MINKNYACRIFKEQIDLILQLPENERAEVLYKSVLFGFNQIDCQFDNQIENQNESAYVSVSDSVSILSNKIFNLLKKNITWKEFSNNYGGSRKGAGAPKGNTNAKKNNQIDYQNDIQIDIQNEKANETSVFHVDCQNFDEIPADILPVMKKYWTDEKIEKIRQDLAFMPSHETCVATLLTKYDSDLLKQEPKSKATRFVKPTVEEIKAYCRERMNFVEPQKFFDYYESNGWKVGKNPMKDWRAAIRTWEKNNYGGQSSAPTPRMSLKDMQEMQKKVEIQKILNGER